MLIDLDFHDKKRPNSKVKVSTPNGGLLLNLIGDESCEVRVDRIETGIYCGSNIHLWIEGYTSYKEIPQWKRWDTPTKSLDFKKFNEELNIYGGGFGVSDNLDQIKEVWKVYWSERKFVLEIYEVYKEHQPPRGGWRWSKWGPYIGKREPKAEYLADEPEITEVMIFGFIEVVTDYVIKDNERGRS